MKDPSNNLLGSWGSEGEVWYQLWENGQPILNTGANGLALLDSAVQQAEAAGIQFIMSLVKCVLLPDNLPQPKLEIDIVAASGQTMEAKSTTSTTWSEPDSHRQISTLIQPSSAPSRTM